jgi:hypothetical protein
MAISDPNIRDRFRDRVLNPPPDDTPDTPGTQPRQLASFPYGGDIGVDSIPGLTALANSSGITLAVVSSFRPGDLGYHGSQNAIDLAGSAESMRIVAAYLLQYAPYLLELIHTNSAMPGGGAYVHNGVVVPQAFFDGPDITTGGNIIQGHRDHVHLAATMSGLQAAAASSERLRQEYNKQRMYDYLTGNAGGQVGGTPINSSNLLDRDNANRGCSYRLANAVVILATLGQVVSMYFGG